MDKNLKFYDLFQHASFINERHGMDARAVDVIPIPGAEVDPEWKDYIIPTWVADAVIPQVPSLKTRFTSLKRVLPSNSWVKFDIVSILPL